MTDSGTHHVGRDGNRCSNVIVVEGLLKEVVTKSILLMQMPSTPAKRAVELAQQRISPKARVRRGLASTNA